MGEQSKLRVAGENATRAVRAIGLDAELCLRTGSTKSTCQACLNACPANSIRLPRNASADKDAADTSATNPKPATPTTPAVKPSDTNQVTITKGLCVDCGLCCSHCPTSALIVMEPTARYLRHLLKRAQAAAGGNAHTLYLTCIETGLTDADPSVVEIPCLGALTTETWVSLMLDFPNLAVYMPADLCPRCKAKAAEEYVVDCVCEAQEIVGHDLTLVELRKELEFTDSQGKLRSESGEIFDNISNGFGDIVRDITKPEIDMDEQDRCQQDQRKARIRLKKEMTCADGEQTPGLEGAEGLTGTITANRATLLDAVMRFPQIAERVNLRHVAVDAEKCTRCKACVESCVLGAAHIGEEGPAQVSPLVCVDCGLCAKVCEAGAITSTTTCIASLLLNDVNEVEFDDED